MQTWSKNFFPGDPHLVSDAGKDGRLDEVALGKGAITASLELGSIFLAALDLKQRSVYKGAQLAINSGTKGRHSLGCVPPWQGNVRLEWK